MNRLIYIILICSGAIGLAPCQLFGQDKTELTVEAPKVVANGEVFRLSYTINAKCENFNGPRIEGFLYNGPMLSTNMSTQIINGQVTQSVFYTYNYTLQATNTGKFTIPAASATIRNKTYTSPAVTIEVVADTRNQGNQQAGQAGQSQGTQPGINSDDLFARVEVDRTQVYKGEQIFAVIKIYTRVNLARLGEMKMPSFGGFWNQEIPTPEQIGLERVNYRGQIYNMGVIRKSILVPQQTGTIVIDPFEIECYVNVQKKRQRSPFDDFFSDSFFGSYETLSKKITSPRVEIQVRPFPPGQPAGFTGAVGTFSLTAVPDKTEVKTNEAISLKVNIKGKGNLKLIEMPAIRFPADLEVYDPKITDNIEAGENGISGSKTFEYLIIPRHAGTFTIPAWSFSYLDPAAGQYRTYTSEALTLNISKGEGETDPTIISTPGKEDIRVIGQDIRFIKTGNAHLTRSNRIFATSPGFYFVYILLILFLVLTLGYFRYQNKNQADIEGTRFRKAISLSRKKLGKARVHLGSGQHEQFMETLLKGLWGYLSDKFNLELSELNRESITGLLSAKEVPEIIIEDLIKTIDQAEFLRYAPSPGEGDYQKLLEQSENIIIQIEKSYRR